MDSTDMELEFDRSYETSKIVRDEDTDVKRKTIDVYSEGREDVSNPPKIRKNVKQSMVGTTLRGLKGSSEIDIYLLEANVRIEGEFDILQWWKVNGDRFEVLGHMARDIWAILVSTVASEPTFSTRGRVVDSLRCSLAPKIVEALICTQN
ncbi:transposase [Cucumis melo var. makuwa]|uniref:Transposase n=1 Tax=Cucumis melo var. makuwa TaxID=1194695 RepID=A0A5D3CTG7_CUCMM|nr:transposase [Cucumis melo var. makuwa]TYK15141.1 transposase [Cucumis melo var. makuwa]